MTGISSKTVTLDFFFSNKLDILLRKQSDLGRQSITIRDIKEIFRDLSKDCEFLSEISFICIKNLAEIWDAIPVRNSNKATKLLRIVLNQIYLDLESKGWDYEVRIETSRNPLNSQRGVVEVLFFWFFNLDL